MSKPTAVDPWRTPAFQNKYKDPNVKTQRMKEIIPLLRITTGDNKYHEGQPLTDKTIYEWEPDVRHHLEIDFSNITPQSGVSDNVPWVEMDDMDLVLLTFTHLPDSWKYFPADPFQFQLNLEMVSIMFSSTLTVLPDSFNLLTKLKFLTLEKCTALTALPFTKPMTSLQYINIKGCISIDALPSAMRYMTSLRTLEFMGCSRNLCAELNATTGFRLPPLNSFTQSEKAIITKALAGVRGTRI